MVHLLSPLLLGVVSDWDHWMSVHFTRPTHMSAGEARKVGWVGAGPDVFSVVSDLIRGFHRSQHGSFTTCRGVVSLSRLG